MQKVKVSPKGQVVIPKPLRDKFGIRKGDEVVVKESRRGILVMKKEDPLKAMIGLFEGKANRPSTEMVHEIRKQSEARVKKEAKKDQAVREG
jgi:AbrB family looped-hinge helix DNA binding protein